MYRAQRNYENVQRMLFDGIGRYDIPELEPTQFDNAEFIGFNYAKSAKNCEDKAVHFFLDDYQFNRVWTDPDRYIPMLQKFKYVLTPDFSLYTDFPKPLQIYNHYRKHWLGAYWQMHGINVIPTICWSDRDSFEWCFDGEPTQSVVAVSSVGTQNGSEKKHGFWTDIFIWWRGYSLHKLFFMVEFRMNAKGILYILSSLVISGMKRRWRSGNEFTVFWWSR